MTMPQVRFRPKKNSTRGKMATNQTKGSPVTEALSPVPFNDGYAVLL